MPKHQTVRDPLVLQTLVKQRPPLPLAIGLDLATNTGLALAYFDPAAPIAASSLKELWLGQLDLSLGPYDSSPMRLVMLRHMLMALNPSIIFHEDVRYSPQGGVNMRTIGQIMARVYTQASLSGALMGVVATYAEEQGIPCRGLGIGQIKKRATGKGNANKEDMIAACNEHFGTEFSVEDYATTGTDNISDAAWVLLLGLEQYGKGAILVPADPE